MALTTSTITGRVPLPTDENLQYAELTFALSGLDTEGADVLPGGISKRVVLIDSDIPAGFELWQNTAGLRGTHYRVLARWTVKDRDGVRDDYADLGIIQIGSDASYMLADLLNSSVPQAVGTFWSALTQAQYDAAIQAASDAQAWAESPTAPGGPGTKSSKTWAGEAEAAAGVSMAEMLSLIAGGFVPADSVTYNVSGFRYLGVTGSTLMAAFGLAGLEPIAPHYLQHWRVVTYGTEGEALAAGAAMTSGQRIDQQARIVAAFGAMQGELIIQGWSEVFDAIIINPGRVVRLARDITLDGICVSSRFNLASAFVFAGGTSATRGCTIESFCIGLDHAVAAASGLRSDLVNYPPAFACKGAFGKVKHLHIKRAMTAFSAEGTGSPGNNGGWSIGRLSYSAMGDRLRINGPLHFFNIQEIDDWVYGLNANLMAIRDDGNSRSAYLGRADNLCIGRFGAFRGGRITIDAAAGFGSAIEGLPIQIDNLALDADFAGLEYVSGNSIIGSVYATENVASPQLDWKIVVKGGRHKITAGTLSGDATPIIEHQGGELEYTGRIFNSNLTVGQGVLATGANGGIDLNGCVFEWPNGARVLPFVQQGGAAYLRVRGCRVSGSVTTAGVAVQWDTDVAGNMFDGQFMLPHLVKYPVAMATGILAPKIEQYGPVTQATINAMVAEHGYLRVSTGITIASNMTVPGQIFFDTGAYLSINTGVLVTLQGAITSSKQHIFRGSGNVVLGIVPFGGDVREVHASWWGVKIGTYEVVGDQAPAIQKIFDAIGDASEGVVRFAGGPTHMASGTTTGRGTRIKTMGIRRSLFKIIGDGFIPFSGTSEAVEFWDVQFEHDTQLTTERVSPYIKLTGTNSKIIGAIAGRAFRSFEIAASGCEVRNVEGFYNVAGSAGSSLVAVKGLNNTVAGVKSNSSGFGPAALVHVGAAITGGTVTGTGNTQVSNIQNNGRGRPFWVDGADHTVTGTVIDGVCDNPNAVRAGGLISIASGANQIDGVLIDGLFADSNAQPALEVVMAGSGTLRDINIDLIDANGTVGAGVSLVRTAGSLNTVIVGPNANLRSRATPISRSGTQSNIVIAPGVLPNTSGPVTHSVTIADDAVYVIDLGGDKFASSLEIMSNGTAYGRWKARAASGPSLTAVFPAVGIVTATGALTGTTGGDGTITVSVAPGGLYYLENRTGAGITVVMTVCA